jgi:class 3 adenylate cyclase
VTLKDELDAAVVKIFRDAWTVRDGRVVPAPEDLGLGNDAVNLDGTVLYADMSGSTSLVDGYKPQFAAEIYKTYLTCAAKVLKSEGATITAYDGDRVMGVFIGDSKNSSAARAALKINYAVHKIVNARLADQYPKEGYKLAHVVGIDTSVLMAARIGVRNDNDLVFVGRSANYAAKLTAIEEINTVFITDAVFEKLNDEAKYGGDPRKLMWKPRQWSQMNSMRIHSSNWTWPI